MEQVHNFLSFLPDWAVGPLVALAIIIIGYFISQIVGGIVSSIINKTGLGRKAKASGNNIGRSLKTVVSSLVFLIFIILGAGQIPEAKEQLQFLNGMMDGIFSYLPQLVIGGVVLAIGLKISAVVKSILSSAMEVAQLDNRVAKFGIGGDTTDGVPGPSLSGSLSSLVGAIIAIVFAVTAIGIWDIPGISQPVSEMLELILAYIPKVIGAGVILGIAIFIGRFVSNLAQSTLPAMGVDNSISAIEGLDGDTAANFVPSKLIGTIAFIGITLMGLTAAMSTLDIPALSNVFSTLLALGGKIVLGFVIIGAGVFIANVVTKLTKGAVGDTLSNVIRYIIIILIAFMGLSEMDLGDGIVSSAFNWGIGAAAVAGAIAFGLGGREWAKAKLQELMPVKKK